MNTEKRTFPIAGLLILALLTPAAIPAQQAVVLPDNQGVVIAPSTGEVFIVPQDWQILTFPGTCSTTSAPPKEIGEIEELLPPWGLFEDPPGDFLLDHPLFEENFGVIFENNEAIPPELDIMTVTVDEAGDGYRFEIRTAGDSLAELLLDTPRTARFGVYLDADLDGLSDYFATTTADFGRGIVTGQDFGGVVQEMEVIAEGDVLALTVPHGLVGEHFDWLAVSGYSPAPDAYLTTPLENVFYVPTVDMASASSGQRMQQVSTNYSGSGQQVQATKTFYSTCPAQGATQQRVPATGSQSYQGAELFTERCGQRGLALWCVNSSYFAKRVFDSSKSQDGWVAVCPFSCGANLQHHWDLDGDRLPDKVFHTVTDADCSSSGTDGDGDGFRDTMVHEYWYGSNRVRSCNLERDAGGNLASGPTAPSPNPRCYWPRKPYADPANVPGAVPRCGSVHCPAPTVP